MKVGYSKMLFAGNTKGTPFLSVLGSIIILLVCAALYLLGRVNCAQFLVLFLGLEGTVLLASSISIQSPGIGDGFWGKFKWTLFEFPKYQSPASFNPFLFYSGLLLILLGPIISAFLGLADSTPFVSRLDTSWLDFFPTTVTKTQEHSVQTRDIIYGTGIILTFGLGVWNLITNYRMKQRTTFINTVTSQRIMWIEQLRQDISKFSGLTHSWHFSEMEGKAGEERILQEIDRLRHVIRLRLNPEGNYD